MIAAIIGIAWKIADDIVGYFQYAEQRSRLDRYQSRTIYLDQRLSDDYAESLIYRLDVWKNIERAIRSWLPEVRATDRALGFVGASGSSAGLDARLRATVAWWLDCVPVRLDDPMPSYREIPPPAGQVGGGLEIRDDGYYPAQSRYVLPSLGRDGYPDRPLVPTWAALGAAALAPHPAVFAAGALTQIVRLRGGPHRKTVLEWLSPREDARDLLRRHQEHWTRYGGQDIDWADGDGPGRPTLIPTWPAIAAGMDRADGDGPGRPTQGEVAPGMWALRGTWTLGAARDVIATLNPRPFKDYLPPPTWSALSPRLERIGLRMTATGTVAPRVEHVGRGMYRRRK